MIGNQTYNGLIKESIYILEIAKLSNSSCTVVNSKLTDSKFNELLAIL